MSDDDTDPAATIFITDAIDVYLRRKAVTDADTDADADADGSGIGTYASKANSILSRFADWIERERGVTVLGELNAEHVRAYANELSYRAERGEYTASTVDTYYAVVRAFLSWCVRGGIIRANPAATERAESALPSVEPSVRGDSDFAPDSDSDAGSISGSESESDADADADTDTDTDTDTDSNIDEDAWTTDRRQTLETYVRERAVAADPQAHDSDERRRRLREYALVALLAHSAVRGSELFRVPEDDRRTGATWDDVDFYAGTIRVLGKSQRYEDVTLLAPARTPLRRYGVVLDPPTTDWPLFPTRHAPSIARRVEEELRTRGYGEDEIESLLDDRTAMQLARERAIAPPAITTEGARSVLRRLCADAGIEVDGDYLTPRGVRRPRAGADDRREATRSKPTLRASTTERAIAVPRDAPPVVTVDRVGRDRDQNRNRDRTE